MLITSPSGGGIPIFKGFAPSSMEPIREHVSALLASGLAE
jgi:hypothetical protein